MPSLTILYSRISRTTSQPPRSPVRTALEREIDRLVYELYDLTPEEIAVVEGAQK